MNPESGSVGMARWVNSLKTRVVEKLHLHRKENLINPEVVFQKGDIFVVRHGQSESNEKGREFVQHPKLTVRGIEQSRAMGRLFKRNKVKFDLVVTSGKPRATQTAINIMSTLGQRPVKFIEMSGFRERNIGVNSSVLGQRTGEVQGRFNQWNESLPDEKRWDARPDNVEGLDLKDFETERDTAGRFQKALKEIEERYPGKSILIISHYYTMSAGLAALSNISPDTGNSIFEHISNTGYFTVRPEHITGEDVSFQVVHSNVKGAQVFEREKRGGWGF